MRRIIPITAALALLVAGGAALALAQAPAKPGPRVAALGPRAVVTAATAYLGLSRQELLRELRGGKSLAEIATARGKSVDGLEAALVTAIRARVDAARAAGRLTAARAERMKARAPQLARRIVNAKPRAVVRAIGKRGFLAIAARYVGLTRQQLDAELRAGKSLAQVATARGKSVDGLEAALLAPVKRKLDRAVAAGRLDAARAAAMLARAEARIERLVDRTRS